METINENDIISLTNKDFHTNILRNNTYLDSNIQYESNYYDNIEIESIGNISMIHINARSVIKNMSNITNYLHTISHKFKIIVITESWLNKDNYHL